MTDGQPLAEPLQCPVCERISYVESSVPFPSGLDGIESACAFCFDNPSFTEAYMLREMFRFGSAVVYDMYERSPEKFAKDGRSLGLEVRVPQSGSSPEDFVLNLDRDVRRHWFNSFIIMLIKLPENRQRGIYRKIKNGTRYRKRSLSL